LTPAGARPLPTARNLLSIMALTDASRVPHLLNIGHGTSAPNCRRFPSSHPCREELAELPHLHLLFFLDSGIGPRSPGLTPPTSSSPLQARARRSISLPPRAPFSWNLLCWPCSTPPHPRRAPLCRETPPAPASEVVATRMRHKRERSLCKAAIAASLSFGTPTHHSSRHRHERERG
jgi:hypothetical protein